MNYGKNIITLSLGILLFATSLFAHDACHHECCEHTKITAQQENIIIHIITDIINATLPNIEQAINNLQTEEIALEDAKILIQAQIDVLQNLINRIDIGSSFSLNDQQYTVQDFSKIKQSDCSEANHTIEGLQDTEILEIVMVGTEMAE